MSLLPGTVMQFWQPWAVEGADGRQHWQGAWEPLRCREDITSQTRPSAETRSSDHRDPCSRGWEPGWQPGWQPSWQPCWLAAPHPRVLDVLAGHAGSALVTLGSCTQVTQATQVTQGRADQPIRSLWCGVGAASRPSPASYGMHVAVQQCGSDVPGTRYCSRLPICGTSDVGYGCAR